MILFSKGGERATGYGKAARRGLSHEEVVEVLKQDGKLGLFEALRCRVRYFSAGVVIGSRAFVDEFFRANRGWFGAKRKDGARTMRNVAMGDLYVLRALRKEVVTPSYTI